MDDRNIVLVLVVGGFLAFFAVILRLAAVASRKTMENVRRLAAQLRLTATEIKPMLGFYRTPEATGTIRGKRVRVYNYTTSSGKSQTTWSAVAVTPAAHGGLTFALSHQGVGTKLQQLFGAKEIEVGDAEFDRAWFIQTNAPEFFTAALLPEVRQKIQGSKGTWKLADGSVVYAERGSFSDRRRCERFAAVTDAACDLADIAEVYAQQPAKR